MALPPYQRHSETSRAAAIAYYDTAQSLQTRVLSLFIRRGAEGMTDHELAASFPEHGESAIRPRRVKLAQLDPPCVVDSGKQRPTPSGRKATVWVFWEHAQ